MINLQAVSDSLTARQVMRVLRREILVICAKDAVRYNCTVGSVASSVSDGRISPALRREWEAFLHIVGIPREQVVGLAREINEAKQDIWEFEDLRLLVAAYSQCAKQTPEQMMEILDFARRVARTASQQQKDGPKMDALVRQALSIPEGERA